MTLTLYKSSVDYGATASEATLISETYPTLTLDCLRMNVRAEKDKAEKAWNGVKKPIKTFYRTWKVETKGMSVDDMDDLYMDMENFMRGYIYAVSDYSKWNYKSGGSTIDPCLGVDINNLSFTEGATQRLEFDMETRGTT